MKYVGFWREIGNVQEDKKFMRNFLIFNVQSRHYMKGTGLILILSLLTTSVFAQFNLKRQMPEKAKYEPASVIDSTYGIVMYERLNPFTEADSVRMCGTYACQSWVEDFYVSGELLHKGFYIDGQLKTYKNYYPNGNLERDFRSIDNYRSSCKLYFLSGKLKSEIKYNDGVTESWIDYNEAGIIIYQEQMAKGNQFLECKKFFFDNGNPDKIMEIKDKKKAVYTYTEYYPDGKVKVQGTKVYSEGMGDYVNEGEWKNFDASGALIKTESFSKGEKIK